MFTYDYAGVVFLNAEMVTVVVTTTTLMMMVVVVDCTRGNRGIVKRSRPHH